LMIAGGSWFALQDPHRCSALTARRVESF
jgi:hypothetical protein